MQRVLKIFIWFVIIYVAFSNLYFSNASLGEMKNQLDGWLATGENGANVSLNNSIAQIVDIGSILTTVGVAVMLGVTSYMGIKYLTAGPDAKAKLKTQLIGVVVSGVVIFGAYYIWKLVISVAQNF